MFLKNAITLVRHPKLHIREYAPEASLDYLYTNLGYARSACLPHHLNVALLKLFLSKRESARFVCSSHVPALLGRLFLIISYNPVLQYVYDVHSTSIRVCELLRSALALDCGKWGCIARLSIQQMPQLIGLASPLH